MAQQRLSEDDELVPISALQHVVYCERQAALIHVERVWEDEEPNSRARWRVCAPGPISLVATNNMEFASSVPFSFIRPGWRFAAFVTLLNGVVAFGQLRRSGGRLLSDWLIRLELARQCVLKRCSVLQSSMACCSIPHHTSGLRFSSVLIFVSTTEAAAQRMHTIIFKRNCRHQPLVRNAANALCSICVSHRNSVVVRRLVQRVFHRNHRGIVL